VGAAANMATSNRQTKRGVFFAHGRPNPRGVIEGLGAGRGWASVLALAAALACQPPPRAPAPPEPSSARAPTAPVHFVGRAGSGVSSSESGLEDRLGSIKARLEALSASLMIFWKIHGPDTKYGGIHGFHDRRGIPKEDAPKGLVQQSRHLWSYSTWYARREKTPEIKALETRAAKLRQSELRAIEWQPLWAKPAGFAAVILVVFVLLFPSRPPAAVPVMNENRELLS